MAEQETFFIETIRNHNVEGGKITLFIKWEKYSESENTWEPIENIYEDVKSTVNEYFETKGLKVIRDKKKQTFTIEPIKINKQQKIGGKRSRPESLLDSDNDGNTYAEYQSDPEKQQSKINAKGKRGKRNAPATTGSSTPNNSTRTPKIKEAPVPQKVTTNLLPAKYPNPMSSQISQRNQQQPPVRGYQEQPKINILQHQIPNQKQKIQVNLNADKSPTRKKETTIMQPIHPKPPVMPIAQNKFHAQSVQASQQSLARAKSNFHHNPTQQQALNNLAIQQQTNIRMYPPVTPSDPPPLVKPVTIINPTAPIVPTKPTQMLFQTNVVSSHTQSEKSSQQAAQDLAMIKRTQELEKKIEELTKQNIEQMKTIDEGKKQLKAANEEGEKQRKRLGQEADRFKEESKKHENSVVSLKVQIQKLQKQLNEKDAQLESKDQEIKAKANAVYDVCREAQVKYELCKEVIEKFSYIYDHFHPRDLKYMQQVLNDRSFKQAQGTFANFDNPDVVEAIVDAQFFPKGGEEPSNDNIYFLIHWKPRGDKILTPTWLPGAIACLFYQEEVNMYFLNARKKFEKVLQTHLKDKQA
ncbi:hypothetical protein FGO68_gene5601 [Halteria grandinella]|uniref:Chromo domain-containing protein n=1 Tax=Halteria grandinella TaxID=5974 RepID=A0A8J8T392_HALGN|nr:hypothetical protein FGO68_gene5601 [Halteria grandinella]